MGFKEMSNVGKGYEAHEKVLSAMQLGIDAGFTQYQDSLHHYKSIPEHRRIQSHLEVVSAA